MNEPDDTVVSSPDNMDYERSPLLMDEFAFSRGR